MTAQGIIEALSKRWPDSEYLLIPEAPQDSSRGGRKIDLLVISLWASRGYERHAVEIKVSYSDWQRELQEAAKADFWWRHTNRFWVAVPEALAERVRPELPDTWGLLSVGDQVRVAAKAPKRKAEDLPLPTMIGVMRAAANAGVNALHRAERKGYDQGYERGLKDGSGGRRLENLGEEIARLRGRIKAFEEASGVKIDIWRWKEAASLVRMLEEERLHPGRIAEMMQYDAQNLETLAQNLLHHSQRMKEALATINGAVNPAEVAA